MSYKKNQNVHIPAFDGNDKISFDNTMSRIADNADLTIRGDSTTFSVAMVVSGFAIAPALPSEGGAATNAPIKVDLGDGISRYKVKIRFVTNWLFPSAPLGISNMLPDPLVEHNNGNHGNAEWSASQHPVAYTEHVDGQVPTYGSLVVVRENGDTYFIERIKISCKEESIKCFELDLNILFLSILTNLILHL